MLYRLLLTLIIAASFGLGCSGLPMEPVDVSTLKVTPPQLLVAKKAQDPLYVVLDPTEVPDSVVVTYEGMKPITVNKMQAFVQQHLYQQLQERFATVQIVSPEAAPKTGDAWVARVRVVEVSAYMDSATNAHSTSTRIFGTLNWSFALMRAGGDDFLFSYAGESRGNAPLVHVSQTNEMYQSTFAAALADMLSAYADKGIQAGLLDAEAFP